MSRMPAFALVGVVGFVVQVAVLVGLTRLGLPYVLATVAAVEAAVLHNFAWHERWTWAGRGEPGAWWPRLLRFHLGAGMTSMVGNLIVTVLGVEVLGLRPALANGLAVLVTSGLNFMLADRWVFAPRAILAVSLLAVGAGRADAAPQQVTVRAWQDHVARVEASLPGGSWGATVAEPEGRTIAVPGGTIHEWRGSVLVPGITVNALVHALTHPGLPPPSEDVLDARVLRHSGDALAVYLKLTRSAVVTVTYDTEHDVRFAWVTPGLATSRSVATSIREVGGGDRGFLWGLNSYWRYRQVGQAVQVDVLSLSLSRSVPAVARPVAGPIVNRIARESLRRTLESVARFGSALRRPS